MPRTKKIEKVENVEQNVFREPYPKAAFIDKYRGAGYNVACTDGVLMFTGNYDIKAIRKMLTTDGYQGSYGVREICNE